MRFLKFFCVIYLLNGNVNTQRNKKSAHVKEEVEKEIAHNLLISSILFNSSFQLGEAYSIFCGKSIFCVEWFYCRLD